MENWKFNIDVDESNITKNVTEMFYHIFQHNEMDFDEWNEIRAITLIHLIFIQFEDQFKGGFLEVLSMKLNVEFTYYYLWILQKSADVHDVLHESLAILC